jgi:hypothetical protein
MLTINWQRSPDVIESKQSSATGGWICFLIGISLLTKPHSSIVPVLLTAYGFFVLFVKYWIRPTPPKRNLAIMDCSLSIVRTGLIYVKNGAKAFIFFKDINLIVSRKNAVVLHINNLKETSNHLTIPTSALIEIGRENFIDQILQYLPAENKVNKELITMVKKPWMKEPKPSWFWVYFGIAFIAILFIPLTLLMMK